MPDAEYKSVCIDFGNAYTKLAIRSRLTDKSRLVKDLKGSQKDKDLGLGFCIPTVVARSVRQDNVRYAFGDDAAGIRPSETIEVFRNWKPNVLKNPDNRSGELGTWRELCVKFFENLRQEFLRRYPEAKAWETRVCLPLIDNGRDYEAVEVMIEVLRASGWPTKVNQPTIYEPVANVWGILTEGVNAAVNYEVKGRTVWDYNLYEMLHHTPFFRRLRSSVLLGNELSYQLLVVDVGAYTTDFGLITLTKGFADATRYLPKVIHSSYEMGVKELDLLIYNKASNEGKEAIVNMSTQEWEKIKTNVYLGRAQKTIRGNTTLTLEASHVAECLSEFCEKINRLCQEFIEKKAQGKVVDNIVLTGGGMRIQALKDSVEKNVHAGRIHARRIVPDEVAYDLIRGASAIGGTSILCE